MSGSILPPAYRWDCGRTLFVTRTQHVCELGLRADEKGRPCKLIGYVMCTANGDVYSCLVLMAGPDLGQNMHQCNYRSISSNTLVDDWVFYGDYGGNGMENVSLSLSSLIAYSGPCVEGAITKIRGPPPTLPFPQRSACTLRSLEDM